MNSIFEKEYLILKSRFGVTFLFNVRAYLKITRLSSFVTVKYSQLHRVS